MRYTKDMSINEIYNLMNSSDKIEEGMLCNWPSAVYIAIDEANHIVAAGSYDRIRDKAVSRGCLTPIIYMASRVLTSEAINSFNSGLEKALSAKKALKATQK
jgi:hypothetical protein